MDEDPLGRRARATPTEPSADVGGLRCASRPYEYGCDQRRDKVHERAPMSPSVAEDDPYELNRFVEAQRSCYARALSEIHAGCKRTHWMWFIFPQVAGLGFSATTRRYAIGGLNEARAYLDHAVLGPRLIACSEAVLAVRGRSAHAIFGTPDDLKLRSSATLFAQVSPDGSVFHRLLDAYFDGKADARTLALLGSGSDRA